MEGWSSANPCKQWRLSFLVPPCARTVQQIGHLDLDSRYSLKITKSQVLVKFNTLWDLVANGMYTDMQAVFLAVFCMIFANLYACHSTQILLLPCSDWLQRLQIFDWEYRPACLPACLLACLVPCLLACLLACLPACLPACLRACLLPCLLARLGSSRGVAQGSRSATFRFCLKLLLVCTCSVSCMVPYYVIRILSNKHIAHGCLHTQYPDGILCWDTLWGVTISHRCPMVISVFHKLQHMFVNGGVWWWCCFLPTTQKTSSKPVSHGVLQRKSNPKQPRNCFPSWCPHQVLRDGHNACTV